MFKSSGPSGKLPMAVTTRVGNLAKVHSDGTKAVERRVLATIVCAIMVIFVGLSNVPVSHGDTTASGFTVVSAVWGTPALPVEAAPGTQNVPLTVTLQYYFFNTAQGISATLNLPPGFTDANGNSATTGYVSGQVPSGTVLPLTFTLDIGPNVPLRSYSFPLTITWGAITNPNPIQSVSLVQTSVVSVDLKGKVELHFTAGQPALAAGTVNAVPITVFNGGTGNATNVLLSITPSSGLVSVLSSPPRIDKIPVSSSTVSSVDVYVPQALTGSAFSLSITGTYSDAYGNTRVVLSAVGVYVEALPTANSPDITLSGFSYSPTLIFPGMVSASLQVVLSNVGTTPALNVNATLIPSEPVYAITAGSLGESVGMIPVGQSVPFTFTLGIRNSSAPIRATLTLAVESSRAHQVTFTIPFVEQPKASFEVVSVSFPQIAAGDGADQITVTLRNTGQAAAQLATFTMQPSYVFGASTQGSFTTTANTGIGTIAPGATVNLTVVIQVNSNIQSGSYPLVFHSTWAQPGTTQPFGQDIRLILPVHPSFFQVANGIMTSVPFLAALVILIVALVALRRARKSRRRTKGAGEQPSQA